MVTKLNDYREGLGPDYTFQGFIYHPDIPVSSVAKYAEAITPMTTFDDDTVASETAKYNAAMIKQRDTVLATQYNNSRGQDLLSSSTLVESPFIIAQIGEYTFGSYTRDGNYNQTDSPIHVQYPNYMNSIEIVKTNGTLNTYVLSMIYQISEANDPNLIDRILSTVSDTREITLSYGD